MRAVSRPFQLFFKLLQIVWKWQPKRAKFRKLFAQLFLQHVQIFWPGDNLVHQRINRRLDIFKGHGLLPNPG